MMTRIYRELVWGGHHQDIESFLRTWGPKAVGDGKPVTVYEADKAPEDLMAATARDGDGLKGE